MGCLRILYGRLSSPEYAQPRFDLPVDRLNAVKVAEVVDLIGDLDLREVMCLLEMAEDTPVWTSPR
jgi:hypothetical protein